MKVGDVYLDLDARAFELVEFDIPEGRLSPTRSEISKILYGTAVRVGDSVNIPIAPAVTGGALGNAKLIRTN